MTNRNVNFFHILHLNKRWSGARSLKVSALKRREAKQSETVNLD